MKKGIKTLILGILLLIIGAFIIPASIILPLLRGEADESQFLVPGTKEYEIKEPGRYYLWNDFQAILDGKTYNLPESIPDGLEITIKDEKGNIYNFTPSTSISTSSGSSAKKSVGYVEVKDPKKLTVSVIGDSEKRVFSFSQSKIFKILGLVLGGVGLAAFVTVAGVGFSVWGLVKLTRKSSGEPVAGGDAAR